MYFLLKTKYRYKPNLYGKCSPAHLRRTLTTLHARTLARILAHSRTFRLDCSHTLNVLKAYMQISQVRLHRVVLKATQWSKYGRWGCKKTHHWLFGSFGVLDLAGRRQAQARNIVLKL